MNLEVPSPVKARTTYPAEIRIPIRTMDIGVQANETSIVPMHTVGTGIDKHPFLVVDLKRRVLQVYFQLAIHNPRQNQTTAAVYHDYRLTITFTQMTKIFQTSDPVSKTVSHLTFLDAPPVYHRRIKNIASTFTDENSWREGDTWFRQTDIVHRPEELAALPIGLRKFKPLVDIGRWNSFNITYPPNVDANGKLGLLCDVLKDFNIAIEHTDRFIQWDKAKRPPPVWKWIDYSESRPSNKASSSLADLIDETYIPLSFPVRYQLEVCISNGYLSEYTMTRDFLVRLNEMGDQKARKLLEHVALKKQVYHDPMKIFNLMFVKGVTDAKIPGYCCYMRSARITPGTIYYNTPSVDISNRVIRHYIEYADHFLRVRFTDEKMYGRINSTDNNTMDEVFTRIKRTLANGIIIGDRHYEFLAFGNSQFREHGAYFFAPLPNLTAANIRAWMGHFNDIRNIAKHAARLGQCFSTTRAVTGCPVQVRQIEDVERNGYTFSDGVGRISKFLAQMAMSELKIKTFTGKIPSAFQFRLGGCKGMLTVSPQAQRQEVHIRPSQHKFAATHNGLEIIRWSQLSIATLNRQLIIVLSALGIPDRVFHTKLKAMLTSLDEAMRSDPQAIYLLKKYVDPNQMTLIISQMVLDGFRKSNEPFLTSILTLWRAWHLKYLKEKARIAIDQGANLLGCMDETGILKGYFHSSFPSKDVSYEDKLAALPEIFVQVSRPEKGGKLEVIEGLCILARNPSLHPGDIRVVRAVNVPELHHLQDVVVFPQTGDRDIASMCSGGDLDGDDYLVIWDPDLLPDDWFRTPMTYASNKARDLDRDVTVDDITSFFVTYMKNDCLPRIAHAHLAWADRLEDSVNEEKCIRLAQLHSDAVDYNKTGRPAVMNRNLQPRMWPHFMEKKHKPKEQIYHSRKILGQLYDAVERVDFIPNLEMPFDTRILDCSLEVSKELLQYARGLKVDYDTAMRRVMAQYEIKTEFEAWSTFVLSHANTSKDYKLHEELGMISSSLKEAFRKECYKKVGGRSFQLLAPLAVAMYRVTHEEMAAAFRKHQDEPMSVKSTPKIDQLPLISFPWVLPHILGKIAMGHYEVPERPAGETDGPEKPSGVLDAGNSDVHLDDSDARAFPASSQLPAQNIIQEDPFGLFEGELPIQHLSPHKSNLRINIAPVNEDSSSIRSPDQLLDFGFSGKSSQSTSRTSSPSTVPMNLLDLDDIPDGNGIEKETAKDDMDTTDVMSSDGGHKKTEVTKSLEIVEEKGGLEPNALDALNELLGT